MKLSIYPIYSLFIEGENYGVYTEHNNALRVGLYFIGTNKKRNKSFKIITGKSGK